MFHINVVCTLNKNIEDVFAVLTDHANYKNLPGINKSTLLKEGDKDKNGVGAVRLLEAWPLKFKEEITRCDNPTRIDYKILSFSPVTMCHQKGEITLEDLGDKTQVTWLSEGYMDVPVIGFVYDQMIETGISRAFTKMLNHIGEN